MLFYLAFFKSKQWRSDVIMAFHITSLQTKPQCSFSTIYLLHVCIKQPSTVCSRISKLQRQVSAQKLCKCNGKKSAYRLSFIASRIGTLSSSWSTFTNPFVNARLEIQLIQTLGVHAKPVSRVTFATAIKSDFRRGEQKREQDKNDPLGGRGRTGEQSGSRLDNGSLKTRHARQLVADEKTVAFQHARAS